MWYRRMKESMFGSDLACLQNAGIIVHRVPPKAMVNRRSTLYPFGYPSLRGRLFHRERKWITGVWAYGFLKNIELEVIASLHHSIGLQSYCGRHLKRLARIEVTCVSKDMHQPDSIVLCMKNVAGNDALEEYRRA